MPDCRKMALRPVSKNVESAGTIVPWGHFKHSLFHRSTPRNTVPICTEHFNHFLTAVNHEITRDFETLATFSLFLKRLLDIF